MVVLLLRRDSMDIMPALWCCGVGGVREEEDEDRAPPLASKSVLVDELLPMERSRKRPGGGWS